jgi:radical SAM superfamily enzyme YgiQ (UPF0313 family)
MPHLIPPDHRSRDYQSTSPLSLLAVAGPLRDAGYTVRLIDAKWEPGSREEIAATVRGAAAVGISCLTGYSVRDGLEAASVAKSVDPEVPVVWGGWHPSFCDRQAAADPRVDVVVRDHGERTVVEAIDALQARRSLRTIAGLTYRDGPEVVRTPDREAEDLDRFPPFAYELLDTRRYVRQGPGDVRHANTIFSRGCPFRCDFCLDSRRRWLALSVERVRSELAFWVDGHHANSVRFFDGNFFLGRQWLSGISRMILDSGLGGKFRWSATGVASRMVRLEDDLLALVRKAGCDQVAIGAESGSEALLAQITNKTTVEHTVEAVRRLTRHGINQYLFFMVGFPVEPEGALEDTLRLIARLKAINPALSFQISFCIPLPGSEMFRVAVERGLLAEPRTFGDWAEHVVTRPNLAHIGPDYALKVRRFQSYAEMAYPLPFSWLDRITGSGLAGRAYAPVRRAALQRLERLAFGFPVEAMLLEALQKLRRRLARPDRFAPTPG